MASSSILIVGPPLTGKTRSLDTLPGKTIHFNFELEGYLSMRKPYVVVPNLLSFWPWKGPELVVVVDCAVNLPNQIGEGQEPTADSSRFIRFIKDCNTLPEHLGEFDNISLDSFAQFATAALNFIVALNGRAMPQIQDYLKGLLKIKEILYRLQSLKKNLVVIAHFQTEKDEITGRGRQVPQVWGKDLPQEIIKWMSTTFQALATPDGKGGTLYRWNTKPEGLVESLGSRVWDNLPKFIDQSFEKLFELVNKGGKL
jgi:hypothetical protein